MNNYKPRFTLRGVLIFLLIIGIFGVIGKVMDYLVQEKIYKVTCLSNEKQIGQAFQQYTQDYDGRLPASQAISSKTPTNAVNGTGWVAPLYGYIEAAAMLKCPADSSSVQKSDPYYIPVSYAINSNTAENPRISTYTYPSRTVLVFEAADISVHIMNQEGVSTGVTQISPAGNGVNGRLSSSTGLLPTPTDPVRYATGQLDNSSYATSLDQYADQSARHSDGANYLLTDGHVKWFRPQDISAGGIALKSANAQSATGCAADGSKNVGAFPCAEGTANGTHPATFSVE